jgi:uncharacterized membrane protein YbhN (UPF0104 family)
MALAPMVAIGLLLDASLPGSSRQWAVPFASAGVLLTVSLFFLGTHAPVAHRVTSWVSRAEARWKQPPRLSNSMSKLYEAFRLFRSGRRTWVEGLLLSCALLISNSALLWSLCRAAEAPGSFFRLLWVSPSVGVATLFPLGVNSIGTQDVSWMKLMAQSPTELPVYLGISLTWHLLRLTWSIPGAIIFPGRTQSHSPWTGRSSRPSDEHA